MKKWYKSKTLIFNGITAIVTIAMALSEQNLSPKMLEVMGTIAAVGNIILRLGNIKPIESRKRVVKEKEAKETAEDFKRAMIEQTKKDLPKFKK